MSKVIGEEITKRAILEESLKNSEGEKIEMPDGTKPVWSKEQLELWKNAPVDCPRCHDKIILTKQEYDNLAKKDKLHEQAFDLIHKREAELEWIKGKYNKMLKEGYALIKKMES